MQFLRSLLLGLAIGIVAAPVALANEATKDAPPTDARAGTGAQRMSGQPLMGPPRAPTVVGQSPLMVTSPDARDFQRRQSHHDRDANRSDLNQQSQTGK
jgi:hypothetical protein